MSDHQLISPERQQFWTVACFVLALIAFVLAIIGLYRTNVVLYGTQIEVLALNKKIESLKAQQPTPAVAGQVKPEGGAK